MIRRATIAVLAALLTAPAGAGAQDGSPFAPLAPPDPAAPQQLPPQPVPQPPQAPRILEPEDDKLAPLEMLALVGIAVMLFGAVAVAIVREGRRMERSRLQRQYRRRRGPPHRVR